MGRCNSIDTRGDYLAEQMIDYGCLVSSPCNFLSDGGPGVYTCTGRYPDSSTIADEFGRPNPFLDNESSTGPRYIIYSDGTGEPDADANYHDLFPPLADPAMLALQKRGKELGCRPVKTAAFEKRYWNGYELEGGDDTVDYSCVISTCEAWVKNGQIFVRQKVSLPDGA